MGLMNGAKIQDGTSNPGNACLDSEGATVVCLMPMIFSGFMAIWVLVRYLPTYHLLVKLTKARSWSDANGSPSRPEQGNSPIEKTKCA